MREGSPSLTAIFVAFARAVATYDTELRSACQDAYAEQLLPRRWAQVVAGARRAQSSAPMRALRMSSMGLIDHLGLRTALIDRALTTALSAQATQLVVLGAGFDSRAHRIRALRGATVFEVDHPSTQALKRKKAAGLPVTAKEIRYTPCDFERVSLDQALRDRGFDPAQKTVWIWEGVTMYLEPQAVAQSLARISQVSAIGSTLIATYMTPEITLSLRLLGKVGVLALAMVSEPVRAAFTPQSMFELMSQHALHVSSDTLPVDAAREFGVSRPLRFFGMPSERVVVSVKA